MVTDLPDSRLEVDAVAPAVESQLDAIVDERVAIEPRADADLVEQIDGALLEQAGADAGAQVFGRASLEHHGVDAGQAQQPREQQPGWSSADDPDLRAHGYPVDPIRPASAQQSHAKIASMLVCLSNQQAVSRAGR